MAFPKLEPAMTILVGIDAPLAIGKDRSLRETRAEYSTGHQAPHPVRRP